MILFFHLTLLIEDDLTLLIEVDSVLCKQDVQVSLFHLEVNLIYSLNFSGHLRTG